MAEQRRLPFLVFVAIAAGLVGVVLYPLWKPLFLGGVFATALSRVHEKLTLWVRNRRGLAATLLTITAILLLLGPVASVAVVAARQAVESIIALRRLLAADDLNGLLLRVPHPLSDLIARLRDLVLPVDSNDLAGELPGKLLQGSQWAAALAGGALRLTSEIAFDLGIMLVTMHVLLVDGRRLVTWLIEVSPLPRGDTQALLIEFKKATRAILTSTLATAAAQGLVSMLGYLIAGAPRPLFFGLATFLCAFIPGIGTALVAVPMACWLFFTGHHAGAVFLVVYFLLVVSMVDNLMKPMLMKSGMRMHGAVVFLSLIGGVLSFGPIGLVAGPLALTFFLAMIRLREPMAS
jgi:predicted PurR-regulated permease PerM